MNYWRAVFAGLTVTVVGFATFSCSSDSDKGSENPGSGLPAVTAIMGQALDTSGSGLASVTVRGGGAETSTGSDGTFQLDAAASDGVVITFEKSGYLKGFKRVDVQEGTPTALRVTLLAEAAAVDMDSDAGGAVAGDRGAAIVAPAAAFVDQGGTPISGTVQVHLTPLDPAVGAELAAYPGDLAARQSDGTSAQLETFGVLDVTVRQDGEELQIGSGKSIDISIPAPSAGVSSPPATVGLWSFDEEDGVWVEEGVATYNADDNTYDATISHLSPWNADAVQESTCVRGRVVDQYDNAIPGAMLQAKGVSYLGWSSATAGNDGEFCVVVQKDSTVEITAVHPLGGGSVRTVSGGSSDTTVPPTCSNCSDVGTWVVEQGSVTGPGGTTVDCSDINSPYVGSCAEGMMDIFLCFSPAGACTYNTSTGNVTYANGSSMTLSGMGGTFKGPGGVLCGSYVTDVSNTEEPKVLYTNPAGDTWALTMNQNGDQTIVCPNGDEVTLTSSQASAIQACAGGSTDVTEECTIEGGGGMPTACTSQAQCAAGEVCCVNYGYCLPDYPGICDG